MDNYAQHVTVRRRDLFVVLHELEHAFHAGVQLILIKSCVEAVHTHLNRARVMGRHPSATVLTAILRAYQVTGEANDAS
jgi:hypothetical protein